jgi:hypothetical protein
MQDSNAATTATGARAGRASRQEAGARDRSDDNNAGMMKRIPETVSYFHIFVGCVTRIRRVNVSVQYIQLSKQKCSHKVQNERK